MPYYACPPALKLRKDTASISIFRVFLFIYKANPISVPALRSLGEAVPLGGIEPSLAA